jgi:plasmid maintenance system killer protein
MFVRGRYTLRLLFFLLLTFFILYLTPSHAYSDLFDSSYSLIMYDDFSSPFIDTTKWQRGEFVREIDPVNHRLISKARGIGYRVTSNLNFRNPDSITYIEADVTLHAAEGDFDPSDLSKYTFPNARITGNFYNDGTGSPGSYLGEVQAAVRLYSKRGSLYAGWAVWKGTSADASSWETLASKYFNGVSIRLGQTYRLSLNWDPTTRTFTFGIDGIAESYQVPDTVISPPNVPWKAIGADAYVPEGLSYNAYVSATFDNVVARDASNSTVVSDDFSSGKIDETKWITYEYVREVKDSKLRIGVRSSEGSPSYIENSLPSKNPEDIHIIQADVTPLKYVNESGALARARLLGRFYNDGTQGGGYLGDINARVYFGGTGSSPKFFWSVGRHTSVTDFNPVTIIASGEFTKPVVLGNTYRLFLGWDGTKFTFKVDDEEATYTPETPIFPPNMPWKGLNVRIDASKNEEAYIEALFDNVMIDSPRLNLSSGWNFISFPRLPADTSISTIMSGKDVRIIWGWDNVNQVWLKWKPLSSDNTLTNFEFGKGYWIYVNGQTTIDMSNWNKPSSSTLTLRPGWNLIGWLGMDNRPISDALSSLNNNWRVIWTWEDGTWYGKHTSLNLPYPELTTLKKGKAYWIKMTNEAIWEQK